MNMVFQTHTEKLPDLMNRLRNCEPFEEKGVVWQKKLAGVYSLEEAGKIVYVGRTRNLKQRLRSHITAHENKASFALKRARIELDRKATYKTENSKKALLREPDFLAAFKRHVDMIKKMPVRFVKIPDPIDQYLFELYAHLEYDLPLDGFDTS